MPFMDAKTNRTLGVIAIALLSLSVIASSIFAGILATQIIAGVSIGIVIAIIGLYTAWQLHKGKFG